MANYKIKVTKDSSMQEVLTKTTGQKLPDAKLHQQISFIKSGIRILGYAALWWSIDIAAILLILSEVVGIKEELV
tara:strand:- start:309 stop:533 length:225 start_codon:yes stop_codon:yes gene_type:complete